MNASGFVIIKWTSSGRAVTLRRASTMGGPMVRFGTKWPSMTSTCTRSAPACSTAAISSAKCAKSDDRMEGAIRTLGIGTPPGNQRSTIEHRVGQRRRLLIPAQHPIRFLQHRRESGAAVVLGDGGEGAVFQAADGLHEQPSADGRQAGREFACRLHRQDRDRLL